MIDKKQLELNAILEVSQAINANLPEEWLYKIFYFTCLSSFQFDSLSLVVFEEDEGKVVASKNMDLSKEHLKRFNDYEFPSGAFERSELDLGSDLDFIDVVIPVIHKQKKLAVVLIGDEDQSFVNLKSRFTFIQTLANIIMVAIENKRLVRRDLKQEALRKEMEIAQDVQGLLFPKTLPDNESLHFFASYLPHSSVSGDYYDCIKLNDKEYLFCVADVSGKGVPAALIMSNFQASLRTLSHYSSLDMKEIVTELNHQIYSSAQGEKFITLFLAKYNIETRKMVYVNCGHNPSLVLDDTGLRRLTIGTTVLGAFEELPFMEVGEELIKKPSLIVNYTDGLTETFNEKMEEFGEERLEQFFIDNKGKELSFLHQELIIAIDEFKGINPYIDDLTLLTAELK
jgi:sigma-B regulation protein RsbU (phosphoserine phosphatase)